MSSALIDEKDIRESFDWIYRCIDDMKRNVRVDVSGRAARMFSIYFATRGLANDISYYWAGDSSKAVKIREEVEHIFRLLGEDKAILFLGEDTVQKHKECLLGIVNPS